MPIRKTYLYALLIIPGALFYDLINAAMDNKIALFLLYLTYFIAASWLASRFGR